MTVSTDGSQWRLLYPPLPADTFGRFCYLQTVQPPAGIINSAVYFRV
jgi:hypothetical protein